MTLKLIIINVMNVLNNMETVYLATVLNAHKTACFVQVLIMHNVLNVMECII